MKLKQLMVLTGVLGVIFSVTSPAFAQYTGADATVNDVMTDRTGRNDLGLQIGGGFSDDNIDDALYGGLVYSHGMSEWLALGIEAGWQEADFDTTDDNDLTTITVFGDIIGRVHVPDSPVVPYGVIGLGVLHAYTDVDSDDDDETAFAAKFGGGLDWFLNRNWALNVEGAYIATGGEVSDGTTGSANTENLDHWRAVGGLKYIY